MKLNLTRRFSNLRFKRAASMSCAKCLGHANSQNERWKKRTRVTVIFPLCFDRYLLGRKKKIQNMAKQKLFTLKRSTYVLSLSTKQLVGSNIWNRKYQNTQRLSSYFKFFKFIVVYLAFTAISRKDLQTSAKYFFSLF